jgi:hypothetical protein
MKTIDAYREVCRLAGIAVLESSRTGKSSAYVRRNLLNQIEDALITAGFDMNAARTRINAATKAERRASKQKRDAEIVAKFPNGSRVQVDLYSRDAEKFGVNRCDQGTVIEPGKNDMLKVQWDDHGPKWISAYALNLIS